MRQGPAARFRRKVIGLLAVVAAALFLGPVSAAAAVRSDFHEPMGEVIENGQPGLLSLTSSVFPLDIEWLEPGDSFSWQVGLHLAGQPVADGFLEFIPRGGLTQPGTGYVLTARRCETQWTGYSGTGSTMSCATGATTLMENIVLENGPTAHIPVGDIATSTSPYILFTLTRPQGSEAADPFTFALGITAMGSTTKADHNLPYTGTSSTLILTAAAVILGAGFTATFLSKRAGRR